MPRPVKIFRSGLTNRVWASRRYKELGDGLFVSSIKDDVTDEAIGAVREHWIACNSEICPCRAFDGPKPAQGPG